MTPIISDAEKMTITVGPKVFDRPQLMRRREWDTSLKAEICGEAPSYKRKEVFQYYGSLLGAKFNRRFQAANYWLWLGNRMSVRTANMLRYGGKHWQVYDNNLVWRAHLALPYVLETEADNLFNIIPAIVTFGTSPKTIRQTVGRGAWRRVANNSLTRNRLIMQTMERLRHRDDDVVDVDRFLRLMDMPSGILPGVMGTDESKIIAARISQRKTVESFRYAVDLVDDTRNMIGDAFNPHWSYARIYKEHEIATKAIMRGRFDDRRFADDWLFEADGFSAILLTSQLNIAVEGAQQHHCVASYAQCAARGEYFIFRIEGEERATASLLKDGTVGQVYAAGNQPVSEDCQKFVTQLALRFRLENKKAA